MKTKPEITDEEIQAFMNFDKLLASKDQAAAKRKVRVSRYLLFSAGFIVVLCGWWFLSPFRDPKPDQVIETTTPPDTLSDRNIQVADSASELQLTIPKSDKFPAQDSGKEKTSVAATEKDDGKTETQTHQLPVYVLAEPADGYPALYEYFSRELVYPPDAIQDSVQGVVTVVFSINTAGTPEKIYVENSLSPLLDHEAIRVVREMPLWKPATYNNKPVVSKMSLPLTFQIQKK